MSIGRDGTDLQLLGPVRYHFGPGTVQYILFPGTGNTGPVSRHRSTEFFLAQDKN